MAVLLILYHQVSYLVSTSYPSCCSHDDFELPLYCCLMDEFLSRSYHADFKAVNPHSELTNTTSRNMNVFWYQLKETSINGIILVSMVRRIIFFELISCNETYRCIPWPWANIKKIKMKKISVAQRFFESVQVFSLTSAISSPIFLFRNSVQFLIRKADLYT